MCPEYGTISHHPFCAQNFELACRFSGNFCTTQFLLTVLSLSVCLSVCLYIICNTTNKCGPGSSVSIATNYWLDGPGTNPGGDEIFPPVQTGPGTHPASCKMGTWSFPGVKCGRGVLLTTHPLLVPRSWKIRAIPLPTLWTTPGL